MKKRLDKPDDELPALGHVYPPPAGQQRWKCVCAYEGTSFTGWQSQRGGNAIQDIIEGRLAQILGVPARINASGRTDAGVHAHGQVFHFDAAWKHTPAKLLAAMRVGLPPEIQIKSVRAAAADFHARFSATGKIYHYQIQLGNPDPFQQRYVWVIERALDFDVMAEAAAVLQGRHDFRAFTALNGPPKEETVRDLRRFELIRKGRALRIVAEADGFMYKMVRSLVGALYSVGVGKLSPADIRRLLATGKRVPEVLTAPPQGLFLVKVFYS